MKWFEIVLIGLGVSMDALAVSLCKGMALKRKRMKDTLIIALYFGFFQALMPVIGYFLGSNFTGIVEKVDHWIAFILLALIGGKMIFDSIKGGEETGDDRLDVRTMILLAIATSIDALAVGISFAFLNVSIWSSVAVIGLITFAVCFAGVGIGRRFGNVLHRKAGLVGGVILVLIGLKIFLEHLGVLG